MSPEIIKKQGHNKSTDWWSYVKLANIEVKKSFINKNRVLLYMKC